MEIKIFSFNSFGMNTYVLSDGTGECAIVDAGCSTQQEERILTDYIQSAGLKPVLLINTHLHIDHIVGTAFVSRRYNLPLTAHVDGKVFLEGAIESANMFGLNLQEVKVPENLVDDGDRLKVGNQTLEVRYTPGHADGSICLVNHASRFVVTGDVLFSGSIGRTDLPTGDYDQLMDSIYTKLLTLDDDYTVYPGHGPKTTIGFEKRTNPFLGN